jgi:drug/metabolite transporter (DMT)-like permease
MLTRTLRGRGWRVGGLFAVAITVWGLNYTFVGEGLTLSPPLWLAFLRVLLGFIVAVPLLYVMRTGGRLTTRQKVTAFLLGIPGTTVFYGLWLVGEQRTPAGLTSVFIYTYPLWALFLSVPILGEHPGATKIGGAFLGFFGVALASQVGFVNVPLSDLGAVAELVAAGFCFALMNVCFKRFYKGDELLRANVWQLFGATVTLGLWAALTTPAGNIKWGLDLLFVLLWLGVLGTSVVYVIFFHLMKRYSASSLTAYFFMVVVVALVSSYIIFGEKVNLLQGIGVIGIIVAIYLVNRVG